MQEELEKNLDEIVNNMTEPQLKQFAKIGLLFSMRLFKRLLGIKE